ncbi:kinase [Oleiphilus sp. HI0009]|nr:MULTISPECIES: AarF/ABC1/UbiB kinase family protein [unclassified Oleiphilus]KZX81136.1 kinase [Oleiphilus sp. HI0009]KZY62769.1 kinase [Oleiphilus sp. HI0066]KZY71607.1 kinase [Oleiphilus sp. HI0067]
MKGLLVDSVKGAFRLTQTAKVLGLTGSKWVLGKRPPNPVLLRQVFEQLGSTYIKLGQFIASSPTFFPKEYVDEFQYCLDQTPPFEFSVVRKIITQELGCSPEKVYSYIEEKPLASASIAQVHAAKLVTGEDVVIKVQKPGVENVLLTDLNFLYVCARLLEKVAPKLSWTSISGVVEEIQKTMMEECDFIKEAKNLDTFRAFLLESDNHDVVVPKVYKQACSRRILTMERFYGSSLTDLESIRKYCDDPEKTLITAMNTWFASLTQCEFFHADVHAGNLMVLDDGRIGFIDFGIVGRINPGTWEAVSDFISSIMIGNFEGMADAMIRIGITDTDVQSQDLAADLRGLFNKMDVMVPDYALLGDSSGSDDDDINNILMEMVRVGEEHGLHFPREFALLLKQFLYFDRYVHILAPELDMFVDARLSMLH